MSALQCPATTRAGNPCRFPARPGTGWCINHDPEYRAQQAENRARGVQTAAARRTHAATIRRSARQATTLVDPWLLSDRASIQALLDTVVQLELAGALPAPRARVLIRAAALAIRNFDPSQSPNPGAGSQPARQNLARYRAVRTNLTELLFNDLAPLTATTKVPA
ncbi:MAG: hypothetical protein ACKVVT_13695 [Dehalococcoidia bacterium]